MKSIPLKFNKERVILFLKTDADGHSVFDSKSFIKELGLGSKYINNAIRRHVCTTRDFKRNTYSNSKVIDGDDGIVCLEFLYWLGSQLGVVTDNPFKSRTLQSKFLIMGILNALEDS